MSMYRISTRNGKYLKVKGSENRLVFSEPDVEKADMFSFNYDASNSYCSIYSIRVQKYVTVADDGFLVATLNCDPSDPHSPHPKSLFQWGEDTGDNLVEGSTLTVNSAPPMLVFFTDDWHLITKVHGGGAAPARCEIDDVG